MNEQDDRRIRLDEDDDDRPVGRVLSRREVLALLGAAGAAAFLAACGGGAATTASLTAPSTAPPATPATSATPTAPATATGTITPAQSTAAATSPAASAVATAPPAPATPAATATTATNLPSCIVRPAATEGPFFVDEKLNRSDIRPDPTDGSVQAGVLLALTFVVSSVRGGSCVAFADALVDVWHCNALGVYSDVSQQSSVGQSFLRGYQVTDSSGRATFTTIYPGWYPGRAVHIHFKIRSDAGASQGLEFTSQLFFDDSVSDAVLADPPYAQAGSRTRNASDSIYRSGGDQLLLAVTGDASRGYAGTFEIGVIAS